MTALPCCPHCGKSLIGDDPTALLNLGLRNHEQIILNELVARHPSPVLWSDLARKLWEKGNLPADVRNITHTRVVHLRNMLKPHGWTVSVHVKGFGHRLIRIDGAAHG